MGDIGLEDLDEIELRSRKIVATLDPCPDTGTWRRDETPPPDDVNEVLAWEGPENGWTTAYRGGDNRDGVASPQVSRDPDWWVWSFGITAKFTWWRSAVPAPERAFSCGYCGTELPPNAPCPACGEQN